MDFDETGYTGVLEAADYESEVRISKFKMADPKLRSKLFESLWILIKLGI